MPFASRPALFVSDEVRFAILENVETVPPWPPTTRTTRTRLCSRVSFGRFRRSSGLPNKQKWDVIILDTFLEDDHVCEWPWKPRRNEYSYNRLNIKWLLFPGIVIISCLDLFRLHEWFRFIIQYFMLSSQIISLWGVSKSEMMDLLGILHQGRSILSLF
jgi:hypothetical protein